MSEVIGMHQGEDTVRTDISSAEHDQNLMLVYAVEGYSKRHNMPEKM